jgi:hypothetical protein
MATEDPYSTPSDSLLPLLKELQLGDALAVGKSKLVREADTGLTAGWDLDPTDLLRYQGRAYVPPDNAVRSEIMKICHDDPLAGHFGQKKTLALVQRKYYWPELASDTQAYVRGCDVCQRVKARRHRMAGEMQALPLPERPFSSITLDFITDLPPSIDEDSKEAFDALLVIVCRYTKVAKFVPYQKTLDAPGFARLFGKYWFKDQGLPSSIVTDRGSVFASKFWSALYYYLRVEHRLSTSFYPQTDSQTERLNQTIKTWLRYYICYKQDN